MKFINKPDLINKPNNFKTVKLSHKEKCEACNSALKRVNVAYRKKGKHKARLSKNTQTYYCESCNCYFISEYLVGQVDELADFVKKDTKIIKEMGFESESSLEIFCEVPEDTYFNKQTSKKGIKIRIQPQSKMFENLFDAITDYDSSDYGHDLSNTLKITPGPPYDLNQRKILIELIAKLQSSLKAPLKFWTFYFYDTIFDEEYDDNYESLYKSMRKIDDETHSLRLLNDIYGNKSPGQFFSVFRLLEHILHLCLLSDISTKRHDSSFSDIEFQDLTMQFEVDLKSRIKYRVDQLPEKPYELLNDIWDTMRLDEDFDENKFYHKFAWFRNKYAHKPSESLDDGTIVLPWEEPPFNQFVRLVIKLIVKILNNTKL